jgi:hypothetical protein
MAVCKHCKEQVTARKCPTCKVLLLDCCLECHEELKHAKIGKGPRGRSGR